MKSFVLGAALILALASPLAGQQAQGGPPADPGVVPVSAPSTPPSGPRLRAEWRPVEPVKAVRDPSPLRSRSTTTITVSTLVLVLVVVIVVLLIF
jgi:hypothetical protein